MEGNSTTVSEAQHIAETNVASEQSDVVAMPLPPQQPTTYYSVWLCPCERKTPALHQLLTAEIVDGAIRTRAPYKPFTPHITLASHLEGFGDDEDSRVAQFREFVASIKRPIGVTFRSLSQMNGHNLFLACDLDQTGEEAIVSGNKIFGSLYRTRPHMSLIYGKTAEWEYEEAVARLLGPAEDTQQLAEEEESNVPSFAPRSGLGALANSSLWATYLPDGAPCAADEFTHMFHTVQLWEIPLSPGQDPSLKTWRLVDSARLHRRRHRHPNDPPPSP